MQYLLYNDQFEIIAAALTTADIIGIVFSIGGIAIGLIIYGYQNKQGKEIKKVVEKLDEQGSRVHAIIKQAKGREDKRKYHHLFFIRSQVDTVRRKVVRRARKIRQNIIENPNVTLEQWRLERPRVETREKHTKWSMEYVSVNFDAISDLMTDLTLAADVNSGLRIIASLLTDIRRLENPTINPSYDRQELIRLLQELNSAARERLKKQLLPRIKREIPQIEEGEGE
jgi:K+ transporter